MNDDDLVLVWKALSDPGRRKILDYLKERPRTTGEICALFDVSRFAVMKHLTVLEESGLVVVRRSGRERWNHLNAVPLQQIYERWLRPYEAQWASSLLQLKQFVELKGDTMTMTEQTPGLQPMQIEQEISINATANRVFEALTNEVQAWWGAPYLISENAKGLVLEPKLGGRFYEDWGDGQGGLWGVVTQVRKNELLEITGPIGMGGPVHAVISYVLEAKGATTLLKFSHQAIGQLDEHAKQGYTGGWNDLLAIRLKTWVEKGERMGLGHEPK
jgi:DNA-binding transcriptional ArsR family regulator/uncharacterized protein YndB with AHSA1/START domain